MTGEMKNHDTVPQEKATRHGDSISTRARMQQRRRRDRSRRWLIFATLAVSVLLVLIVAAAVWFGRGQLGGGGGPGQGMLPGPEGTETASPEAAASKTPMPVTAPPETPEPTPTRALPIQPVISPTEAPEETPMPRLAGLIIGIDPGHQSKGDYKEEPIAPGSKQTKARTSSGTQGVKTRNPEYAVVLDISLMLRDALEAQGAQVVMTREINEVKISNIERAQMMNEAEVDLCLRIHLNGSENRSVQGISLYVSKSNAIAGESRRAAQALLPTMVEATGAKNAGIHQNDTYTGLNWSEVPCILVEMGYMSNPEEDEKTSDPDYQALLVEGMVEGVAAYFDR